MTTRKAYIDAAKCLGIILVLMNHIELQFPFVNFYGGMFYVPVFFVAAGLTYYNKEEGVKAFAIKKAKRLLVPYFICNVFLYVFFMAKNLLAGNGFGKEQLTALIGIFYSRNSLYIPEAEPNVYFMTILNSPTWFLTAMFLTYLLMKISFMFTKGKKKELFRFALFMFAVGVILHYFCLVLLPWSLECIPFFYCYMISGYFIREEGLLEKRKPLPLLFITLLFFASCQFNGSANISIGHFGKGVTAGLFNGIFSSFLILWLLKLVEEKLACKPVKAMAGLGKHTLTILCYHYFILVMVMMVLGFLDNYLMNWIMQYPDWVLQMLYAVEKLVAIVVSIATCVMIDGIKRKISHSV